MKRLAWLFILLFAAVGVQAQLPANASLTTVGTAAGCTVTSTACLYVKLPPGTGAAGIELSGTWTGTVSFYDAITASGVTKALSSTDATPVSSATANGAWQFNTAAFTRVLVVFTTATSGTVVVNVTSSPASARIGGSTGGGTFTAGGDLSGTSSSQTVIGINNVLLSGLATGIPLLTAGVPSIISPTDCTTNVSQGINASGNAQCVNTISGSFNAASLSTGSSPPAGCSSITGCFALAEQGTPGTPTAGVDYIRADSVTHEFLCSLNGGAEANCAGSGSGGTVTSVGFTGGLISVGTPTTTPAFTVAGTSGGIPYFSSATTWASSGALGAHGVVLGEGAGNSPVATAAGTSGQCFISNGASADPTYQTCPGGSGLVGVSVSAVTVTSVTTAYTPFDGGGLSSTTEANVDQAAPDSATISNFYAQVSIAPGAGNTFVITLRDGAASKSVTCTISGASATSCSDLTHSFTPAAGDLLDWQITGTGTITVSPNFVLSAQWGGSITSGSVANCGTTNALAIYTAGTTTGCGNADFTYATHTITAASTGIVNLSAEGAAGLVIPTASGIAPTADGDIADDSGCHALVYGSNGATRYDDFHLRANASSDQITSAGAFATTLTVPSACLFAKSIIIISAHGVYTTTSTSSPIENFEVNAGGTTGICPGATAALALTTSQTSAPWDLTCKIQIVTTGTPGTAYAYGNVETGANAGSPVTGSPKIFVNTSTVSYTTSTGEAVTIQETGTMVNGQTFNLQYLTVDVQPE
jgi:hypothetical protein